MAALRASPAKAFSAVVAAAFGAAFHAAAAQPDGGRRAAEVIAQATALRDPGYDALRCQGNEPGWLLITQAGQARLRTQDAPGHEINAAARFTAAPWARPPFGVLRTDIAGSGTMVVLITEEACADTMSDAAFPMQARVSMPDGTVRAGCCRPVQVEADPRRPDDWSQRLGALLPVVQSCTVARPGRVLAAWPMNHGKAGVRIADPDGSRFDCIADAATRQVERIVPVAHADRLPDEGQPTLRVGQPARPEACRVIEPVRAQDGTLVGTLAWEACR